jgi:cobalt-zinc-cadmium efflux system outer membrane protein
MLSPILGLLALVRVAAADPLTADEVVVFTLRSHPAAVAARAEIPTAQGARRGVSTLLMNPEVQAGFSGVGDLTFLQVQQPFSLTGEGWYARRAAQAGADAAAATATRAELELAAAARLAWLDAAAAQAQVSLAEEGLALAARLRAAVEARAAAGELAPLDVALARSREASAAVAAMAARQAEVAARVRLAAYHPGAADGIVGALGDAAPRATVDASPRSEVVAAEARAAQARATLGRARASAVPMLSLGLQFQSDGGSIDLGPMLTWGLPLWQRSQAEIAAARGEVEVADAALTQTQARAAVELRAGDAAATRAEEDRARVAALDGAAGLAAIEDALARGELDVRDAVLLQRELLDGRAAAVEAERLAAESRLVALLAHEDPALLGSGGGDP